MTIIGIVSIAAISASGSIIIDKEDYRDRVQAYWLGQLLANWTGIRTEHVRPGFGRPRPFYTDAHWGTYDALADRGDHRNGWIDWVFNDPPASDNYIEYDPWWADDDTDIEYLYLHLLDSHQATTLTPAQIREGWLEHIIEDGEGVPQYLWASNRNAWESMRDFQMVPPMTGMLPFSRDNGLMIDAQLTTESIGLLAPAMPRKALEMADLPIATTADGFAFHAAQFNVLLASLASAVDRDLGMKDQVHWIMNEARKFFPDSSRVAEMYDFIREDYLMNPDKDNWESTRDKLYNRYQEYASAFGFTYRNSVESAINHAAGIMALFYGEGDYLKTVKIGVLAGWDSDNPTASNGGLLAFLYGYEAFTALFPNHTFSDRYKISRTRKNFPDYLPDDPEAEDTLSLLSQRMMSIVDLAVEEAGEEIDEGKHQWIIRNQPQAQLSQNPRWILRLNSANIGIPASGGSVSAASNAGGTDVSAIVDGFEYGFTGEDLNTGEIPVYISPFNVPELVTLTATYDREFELNSIRFVQGSADESLSGRLTSLTWEALVNGEWILLRGNAPASIPASPLQEIEFTLNAPLLVRGLRVSGHSNGADFGAYELDGFTATRELDGWMRHGAFALVYVYPIASTSSTWFWSETILDWIFHDMKHSPWVWIQSRGWRYFVQTGPYSCWLYDPALENWEQFEF